MSAAFIVAPRSVDGGRRSIYDVIDTAAYDPETSGGRERGRSRLGSYDDEHQALALAAVLNGADAVYRAELRRLDNESPF